ncbi:MAG TPA: DUF4344 domain-containing metallopeptidase [Pelagibacterium sp.]|uniref:DUF4344 domain-containing metallopeptidase n=1 Tax=Pelagibacterium sp. TaxID=1967288 RepID=UPI002C842C82|nr:DUF4344 domain-containing metallopeptidase [Pelagibacterium sp.]HWJ87431.1 DUF4344 domain-containing metallopeptidase [Pelagibacterium sp.]
MPKRLLAALLIGIAGLSPATAQTLTNAQRDAAITFALNNTRHTMLHEIGHLLVDQLNLPVLGREEDAVDMMATLNMLDTGTEADIIALQDTVDGWLNSEAVRPSRGYVHSDFYGVHSLDIQRSYSIACLMVGSDFERHTRFATRISLPIDRQDSCAEDFRLANAGWASVLKPHRRAGAELSEVTVEYRSSWPYAEAEGLIRGVMLLEHYADWLAKSYDLPHPVHLSADVCDEVNAFYDPDAREVILCYEWVDYFYEMYVSDIMPKREHFAMMRKLKLEKIGRFE